MKFLLRLSFLSVLLAAAHSSPLPAAPVSKPDLQQMLAERPRLFEENVGQLDHRVRFLMRGRGYQAFVQPDAVVYTWFDRLDPDPSDPTGRPSWMRDATIRMSLEGADAEAAVEGIGEAKQALSYLAPRHPDPQGLRPNHFERVAARSVYAGVDVEYYLRGGELEHDYIVSPGADPAAIRMRFDGVDSVEIAPSGDLLLRSGEHMLVQQAPFVYQGSREGGATVAASYRQAEDGAIFYEIGEYDRDRALVIDPIAWTTYAGGSGVDFPLQIHAGLFGQASMVVFTTSPVFPVSEEGRLVPKGQSGAPQFGIAYTIADTAPGLSDEQRWELYYAVLDFLEDDDPVLASFVLDAVCEEVLDGLVPNGQQGPNVQQGLPPTVADRIRAGATLMLLGGSGQNLTSTDGTTQKGRLDGFIAALLLPGSRSAGATVAGLSEQSGAVGQGPQPLVELLRLTIVGGEGNDQILGLRGSAGCKDGQTHVFAGGSSGELEGLDGEPATPHGGGLDGFQVAFSLDFPGGDLRMPYRGYTYIGGDGNEVPRTDGLHETEDGKCAITTVLNKPGGDPNEFLIIRTTYDPSTGEYDLTQEEFTLILPESSVPVFVQPDDQGALVASHGGPQGVIADVFGRNLADPQRVVIGGGPMARVLGTAKAPAKPGEVVVFYQTGIGAIDPPPTGMGGFGIPAYGTADGGDYLTLESVIRLREELADEDNFGSEAAPRSLVSGGGADQASVVSQRLLGGGRNAVFHVRPGGSYAFANLAMREVFGPVNGVTPPEPLRALSADPGPGDLAAAGGMVDAEWVMTLVGPASFRQEPLARGGIGTGFAFGLAPAGQSANASSVPLTNDLLGAVAVLIDSAGQEWPLGEFFVNSNQVNFHVPPGAALGRARIEVRTAAGALKIGETLIVNVAPNAFTFGGGDGAALTIRVAADGTRVDTNTIATPEITVADGDTLVFSIFVTGTAAGESFRVICAGMEMPVLGAAPSNELVGVEQIAFDYLFTAVAGTGPQRTSCSAEVDGRASNEFFLRHNYAQ